MNDLIKEIQHDMEAEKLQKIFTQYGKELIMGGVAIVVITALFTIYHRYDDRKSRAVGSKFMEAFDDADIAKYDEVIAKGQKGYSPMAALAKAGVQNSKGKVAESIATLDKIANDNSYDAAFRNIALIDKAFLMIKTNDDEKKIIAALEDATKPGAPFRATGMELKASYLIGRGDNKAAAAILRELAANKEIPSTLQERAKHVLSTINE